MLFCVSHTIKLSFSFYPLFFTPLPAEIAEIERDKVSHTGTFPPVHPRPRIQVQHEQF